MNQKEIKVPIIKLNSEDMNESIELIKIKSGNNNTDWDLDDDVDMVIEGNEEKPIKNDEINEEKPIKNDEINEEKPNEDKYYNIMDIITQEEYDNFNTIYIGDIERKIKRHQDEFLIFNNEKTIENIKLIGIIKNDIIISF